LVLLKKFVGNAVFDVLSNLLTTGAGSKLNQRLVLMDKTVNSVGSANGYPGERYHNFFTLFIKPQSGADLGKIESAIWDELKQIKEKGYSLDNDKFMFLAGKAYRQYLEPEMKHVETPFEGLRIGQQKKALLKALKEQLISFARYIINEVKKINLL
jgi:predicted Zn-dependent peptidase